MEKVEGIVAGGWQMQQGCNTLLTLLDVVIIKKQNQKLQTLPCGRVLFVCIAYEAGVDKQGDASLPLIKSRLLVLPILQN